MAYLNVGSDGKAPTNAGIGDVIRTAGGDFRILGGSNGRWLSERVSDTAQSRVVTSSSGGSRGGGGTSFMEPWQVNMQNVVNAGQSAIQAEIERANAKISQNGFDAATGRFISQMTALKDGAKLTDVFAGKFDSYGWGAATSSGVQNENNVQSSNGTPSYGTPEWYAFQSYLEQQFANNVKNNEANGDNSYQLYLAYKSQMDSERNIQKNNQLTGLAAMIPTNDDDWMAFAKKGFLAVIGLSAVGVVLKAFGK